MADSIKAMQKGINMVNNIDELNIVNKIYKVSKVDELNIVNKVDDVYKVMQSVSLLTIVTVDSLPLTLTSICLLFPFEYL